MCTRERTTSHRLGQWGIVAVICVMGCIMLAPAVRHYMRQDKGTTVVTPPVPNALRPLFDAIAYVESKGDFIAVGPGGEIGMYQLTPVYVDDVNRILQWRRINGRNYTYADRYNPKLCEEMMIIYWEHYTGCVHLVRDADWSDLVRIHYGGPNGHKSGRTIHYWNRVQTALAGYTWENEEQYEEARHACFVRLYGND